jgi:ferredoxin
MIHTANPDFQNELARFGAGNAAACFNCGNCTAVCLLSEGDTVFPRKLIRYVQLGLTDKLVQSPEPWLCYYCAECSATCPRDAQPGEIMAALRRYAIASLDPTGLAGLMYRSPALATTATLLLAGVFALFLVSLKPSHPYQWIFALVPYEVIHTVGMVVAVVFAVLAVIAVARLMRQYSCSVGGLNAFRKLSWSQHAQAWKEVSREIATMKRHSQCDADQAATPWYLRPRFVHGSIMAGFLGLFAATVLDFVFIYLLHWSVFLPARVLGTLAGLLMLYGVSVALYQRYQGQANHLKHSTFADWWLLVFLFVLAITGFWLDFTVTLRWHGRVHDAVLLLHTVMAMELLLLFMISKLAHAIYRPLSLGLYFLQKQNSTQLRQS